MKVLWISNIPFGPLCDLSDQVKSPSGSWLDATFDALKQKKNIELTIVTVSRVKKIKMKKEGNHTFYILPGGYPSEYDCSSIKNKRIWERIKEECKPDLIQVWGTEFTHGYLALQVMKEVPSLVYMQGLMGQIARHYLSGISDKDLKQSITLRDILKIDWIKRQKAKFYRRSFFETKMIQLSGNVIVENEWCGLHCKTIDSACKIYKSKLSIKDEFYKQEWNVENIKPYSVMSNASGYPIKGLHILLKAMNLVVQKYPTAKLVIPGEKSPFDKSLFERCKINGYTKYLMKTINILHLRDNVNFLGKLSSLQMAEMMANSNVFVMPSSIENHSSTLIEAMIVGTPSISSYAGGVPEYMSHNVNGLIYRFEEYEILAAYIIKIFEDITFASKISSNARITMRNSRNSNNLNNELLEIYQKVIES